MAAQTSPFRSEVDDHVEDVDVYFDHNATTPLDPRVRDAMLPWFGERHGNPSSVHRTGRAAQRAVAEAREHVANLIGGRSEDLLFTASGTEANNSVIEAIAAHHDFTGRVLLTALEHPSITAAAARAARQGMEVMKLAPDISGLVSSEAVKQALDDSVRLACVMLANNELGTLQPIAEIAAECAQQQIPVLCDAVQAIGKIPVDVEHLGVDYLCLGGHKFYAPPGIAALWLKPGAVFAPWLVGGSQEHGRRASTENVPAIVGLGEAARLTRLELEQRQSHLRELRDRFEAGLATLDSQVHSVVHCPQSPRLPNTSHVAFKGVSGHRLMLWLDERGFAVSTGSACHAGKPQPSATLLAMGVDQDEALASLRISFGITNEAAEVDLFLTHLLAGVQALR